MPETRMDAEEYLEREMGSRYHRASLLAELAGAVEAVRAEFEFDRQDLPEGVYDALAVIEAAQFRV